MLLKFQPCPQSAEKHILRLILLKNIFLTIFADLLDLGALVTGPTSALKCPTNLQTLEKDIELLS